MTRLFLITLLLLSSSPVYAEWVWIDDKAKDGMTTYANPDTIRRKGDLVKMWTLFDFKTAEHVADTTHLSFKEQDEYDCTKLRTRRFAGRFFSGNMGSGKVVYSNTTKDKWGPVPPGSVSHDLWKLACSKGQSSGLTSVSPPSDISAEELQTLHVQAAQSNAQAQAKLGAHYDFGQGVAQDYATARQLYERAAARGHAGAQYNLGVLYSKGRGVPQDYATARLLYEQAAAQGNASAQINLGELYQNGQGVPQDYARARQWWERAAAQGYEMAQFNLGLLYDNGQGVPQDYGKARQWYEKAAAQGHAKAQNNLGWLYRKGQGVPQDYAQAAKWYEQAAAQGHTRAQTNLAELYYAGLGVPQDDVRAYMWVNIAAAHMTGGEQGQAVDAGDEIAQRMTPAQIAEAKRLTQQCQAQGFKGC